MKLKQPYIFFFLTRLPLLLLYISFFIVQLFYNLDIVNHAVNNAPFFIQVSNKQNVHQETVKKASEPTGKTTGFRLNKRYHPQPAITCGALAIQPVVCCVSSKLHVHYSSGFVPSSLPPVHSLRGPPAVV